MKTYEMLFIIDGSKTDEQRETLIGKVRSIIEKEGGTIQTVDKMGIKKFAYPINFKNEGFYCLMTFEATQATLNVLNAQLLITDGIVRHLCLAKK